MNNVEEENNNNLEVSEDTQLLPNQLLVHDSVPIDIICKISETLSLEPVGSSIEQVTRIQENYPNALNSYISLSDTLSSSPNQSDIDWIQELGHLLRIAEGRNYEQSIIAALYKVKTLPYYKNYPASSGFVHAPANHEEAIAIQLKSFGFRKIVPSNKLNRDSVMNPETRVHSLKDVPNGSFIEQPFGTHQSPDFIVKVTPYIILFLEAKSSETTTHPTYNSGTIEPHFIYIFCSKKTDQTTIFKGECIVTREQQRLLDQHIIEARQRDKELNERLKEMDQNHRGVCFYTRPMYNQSGGQEYTNYFTHSNRVASEEHAIEWVREQCQNL